MFFMQKVLPYFKTHLTIKMRNFHRPSFVSDCFSKLCISIFYVVIISTDLIKKQKKVPAMLLIFLIIIYKYYF